MKRLIGPVFAVLVVAAMFPGVASATTPNPYLVKDINPNGSADPQSMVALGNRVFFTADDGVHGRELWVSDGTKAGTYMVKDILPGVDADYAPYWPIILTPINGVLYFSATDGVHGYEPWVSDGTDAGTHMLKDIDSSTGVFGSDPGPYVEMNGFVYFSAYEQVGGRELWRTDGTQEGTRQVADLTPGAGGSYPEWMTVFKDRLYFVRHDASNSNVGTLFRTDGTAAGTKAMRDSKGNKIKGTFNYGILEPVGDHLFIGRNYKQLWVSGGTPATTKKLVDIGTRDVVGVGNTAYFNFEQGAYIPSSYLFGSDGTTAGTQPITYSDGTSTGADFLTPFDGKLIFVGLVPCDQEPCNPGGLSITDGTSEGTHGLGVMVAPVDYEYTYPGTPRATLNSVLYFPGQAYDGLGGFSDVALWRTDGTTAGTYAVSPEYPKNVLDGVVAAGGKIFYAAKAGKGSELYAYVP